jgi:acyl carrier protein
MAFLARASGTPLCWGTRTTRMLTEPKRQTEHLLADFRALVREVTEQEVPPVQLETAIVDLGIESLALYEVIGELERRYGIALTDAELVAVRTVGDLLTLAGGAALRGQSRTGPPH